MATRSERCAGFTLVEVLIGTTLLAVMMSLLMGALFSIGRSTRAGEARLELLDSDRLIQAFLREQIAGAVPLTLRVDRDERVLFEGSDDFLRFVGHLPAHRGGGGLQYLELAAKSTFEETRLVLSYRNAWSDAAFEPSNEEPGWQHTVLVRDVTDLRIRYFGSEDDETPARWHSRWSTRSRLPSLVEIELDRDGGPAWPTVSIAIQTTTADGQRRLIRTQEAR